MVDFKRKIKLFLITVVGAVTVLAAPATALAANVEINEFMVNPGPNSVVTDANGEWIELINTTDSPIDVGGWTISSGASGGTTGTIPGAPNSGETVIPAHGTIVICKNSDPGQNGSVKCTGQVNMNLVNLGGSNPPASATITLKDDTAQIIDTSTYTPPDVEQGVSLNTERDGDGNKTGLTKETTKTYGKDAETSKQFGTPGENKITSDNAGKSNHTYGDINHAVDDSESGDTVSVGEGTYNVREQINVTHDLNLQGAGKDQTKITKNFDTGTSGDSRGWFLVQGGNEFNISDLTLDGSGTKTWQALRVLGTGSANNVSFSQIKYDESTAYQGTGVASFGNFNVTNSEFNQIGRIGVIYYGTGVTDALFNNNTYTGKGEGNFIDYALEVGAGANVSADNNVITNNLGVASSDGSTSAGVLVTTYYGTGSSTLTLTNSKVTGNTSGIAIGYDAADLSTVTATGNSFANNDHGISAVGLPNVNAQSNWYGDKSGPKDNDNTDLSAPTDNPDGLGCEVLGPVDYSNWLISDPFGENYAQCDQHVPSVTITNPDDNDIVNGTVDIRATVADEDDDIASCKVVITDSSNNEVRNVNCDNTGTYSDETVDSWDTTGLADGEYTITVNVEDSNGNQASDSINVTVDNTAPVVTIDEKTTTDPNPELTGTVDDPNATVEVTVDGNTYTATNNGDGTWTLADDAITPALDPGTYDVSVSATDSAGNVGHDATTDELTIVAVTGGSGSGGLGGGSEVVADTTSADVSDDNNQDNFGSGAGNIFSNFFQPVVANDSTSGQKGNISTTSDDSKTLAATDCGPNKNSWFFVVGGAAVLSALLYLMLFTKLIQLAQRETAALITAAVILVGTSLLINTICGNHLLHYLIITLFSIVSTAYALRQFRALDLEN